MITQDDVIYFIVTDRFFDGDTANNYDVDRAHPRRFHGGDLKGILEKIPYIKSLGATAVWITPVYSNVQGFDNHRPYHYYWAKDFDKLDQHLYSEYGYPDGSRQYLADFVQTMHDNGLKVILDVVVNHGGYNIQAENPAFGASWFNGPHDNPNEYNSSLFGLPDFNHDNVNVSDYFIHNLAQWVETGIDGLRMDTACYIEPRFWYYYKSEIKGRFPGLFLVGEILRGREEDISMLADYQRDFDFSSVFDFPLREQAKNCFIYDEPLYKLARPRLSDEEDYGILDYDNSTRAKREEGRGGYSNANRLVTLLDNHDLDQRITSHARSRHPGEEGKGLSFRTVALCYAFLFTVRGIPQIYYGSEVGLEGWTGRDGMGDADLRRDFPWEKLDGDGHPGARYADEQALFRTVQQLIATRKDNRALRSGTMITLWVDHFVLAFLRYIGDNVVLAVFNNGYDDMPYPLDIPLLRIDNKEQQTIPDRVLDLIGAGNLVNAFDRADSVRLANGHLPVALEGKSFKIYRLEP